VAKEKGENKMNNNNVFPDPEELLKRAVNDGFFEPSTKQEGKFRFTVKGEQKLMNMSFDFTKYVAEVEPDMFSGAYLNESATSLIEVLDTITRSRELTFLLLYAFDNKWAEFYENYLKAGFGALKHTKSEQAAPIVKQENKVIPFPTVSEDKKKPTFH
jgi:hypothetical protein